MIVLAEAASPISQALMIAGACLMVGLALLIFFIVALVRACGTKAPAWIIGCVLSAFLALGSFVLAGVYGVAELQKFIAEGDRIEKPMAGRSGRFQLTVPRSWTAMPQLNKVADLGAGNLMREQYLVLITEPKDEVGMDLEAFAKFITAQMQETMRDARQGEFEKLTVGGYPALRCRLTGRVEGIAISYQHTSVETGDALCQILCWTLAGREKIAFPLFERVAATFAEQAPPKAKETIAKAGGKDSKPPPGARGHDAEKRVLQMVVEQLGVDASKVTVTARLTDDLGADDLDLVELVMAMEEEFDVSIADEEAEKWHTVGDVVKAVSAAARPAAAPKKGG